MTTLGADIILVSGGSGVTDHGNLDGLLDDDHTQYQKESEKGQVDGYASLDGSGTIPDAQIPASIARDSEVPTQAVQSAIEAETNENTYLPPDLVKHSPGVAKAWLSTSGGGSPTIQSSYNIASIVDTGVGILTVTIDVDFSSADFSVVPSVLNSVDADGMFVKIDAKTVGSVVINALDESGALADPDNSYFMVAFGDQ